MVYGMACVWKRNVTRCTIYKFYIYIYKILEKNELDIQKYVIPNLPRDTKKVNSLLSKQSDIGKNPMSANFRVVT